MRLILDIKIMEKIAKKSKLTERDALGIANKIKSKWKKKWKKKI